MENIVGGRRDLLKYIRFAKRSAVMYPWQSETLLPRQLRGLGQCLEWAIELFLYLVCTHIAILYVCTMYVNYHTGDLELFVNCLMQTLIYIWTITMKVYFRRLRPRLLEELVESINFGHRTRSAIGFTYVTMDHCLDMSNKYIKRYLYFCFAGAIFWLMVPIAYGNQSLPLNCWYPFDYKKPIIYETVYFLQSVAQIQVAAAFSSSSGFHMVLAILISGQYDVLFCSLKNILATVAVLMRLPKDDLSKLRELHRISEPEANEYYCSQEMEYHIDSLYGVGDAPRRNHPTSLEFRDNFRIAVRKCIEHHRYIQQCLKKMESFYSPIWFLKTGQVILLLCLVAFVSVKSTNANSSFMKILSLGQYLLLVVWELLIICYFGEILYFNSRRGVDAFLRSPWYLHIGELKNDILIFMRISQRPFVLTAGRILALNLDQFRGIITTAFSFLTLLQNMDERI